jgi:hypothetical protein
MITNSYMDRRGNNYEREIMIEANVKKIAVLFIDTKTNAQWSILYDVGKDKYLVRLGDYIRAATCHPTLQDMRNVGLTEICGDKHDGIAHGTITNRWL